MAGFLFVMAVLVGLLGVPMMLLATTALTQIFGAVLFVAATQLLAAAFIVDAVDRAARRIVERLVSAPVVPARDGLAESVRSAIRGPLG